MTVFHQEPLKKGTTYLTWRISPPPPPGKGKVKYMVPFSKVPWLPECHFRASGNDAFAMIQTQTVTRFTNGSVTREHPWPDMA
jgi:hypothetical protein